MVIGTRMVLLLTFCVAFDMVRAEVLSSGPTGFLIENAATVPADAMDTWNALVNEVGRWWPADHTWFGQSENLRIEPRAGGCFCEIDGERQVQHMTIGFVDPGRLLRMLGGLANYLTP